MESQIHYGLEERITPYTYHRKSMELVLLKDTGSTHDVISDYVYEHFHSLSLLNADKEVMFYD